MCNNCNSNEIVVKSHKHEYTIHGRDIIFYKDRRFCKECGSLVYDSVLDNEASKEAIRLYNEKYDINKDDIIRIKNPSKNEATEYNGFTDLNLNKVKNLFLLLSEKSISKTKLNKELFYVDFLYYKKYACSLTGLVYSKLQFGPVPDDFEKILENYADSGDITYQFDIEGEYERHTITSNTTYDKTVFSPEELDIINFVKNKFDTYTPEEIVDYSHQEKAFKDTLMYQRVSYEYALDLKI